MRSATSSLWKNSALQAINSLRSGTIGRLTALRVLKLNQNQLTKLPDAICTLANLVNLSVQNNPLETLPAAIGNLVNLRMLRLDNNQLRALPDSIGQLVNLLSLGSKQPTNRIAQYSLQPYCPAGQWRLSLRQQSSER